LVNRSEARIEGVELFAHAPLNDQFEISVNATFSRIDLDGQDRGLLNRPENYGGVLLQWRPDPVWTLSANAQIVGERSGSSIPTGPRDLKAYERIDLAASRVILNGAEVFFAADNVLDQNYEEAAGFPSPGRRLRAGISWAL